MKFFADNADYRKVSGEGYVLGSGCKSGSGGTEASTIFVELKPCPFCGGMATLDHLTEPDDYFVRCADCEVQEIANYMPLEAARRWNRRTPSTKGG